LAKVGLVPRLFDALHLLYEDLKLEVASAEDLFDWRQFSSGHAAQPKLLIRLGRWRNSFGLLPRDLGDGILSTDQEALSQQQSTGKTVSFTSSFRSPASFSSGLISSYNKEIRNSTMVS
jgi:hypothetical protein